MSYYLSPWTGQGPELVPRVSQQQQPMLQVPTFQVPTYQPPVGHVPQSVQAQVILPCFTYQQSQQSEYGGTNIQQSTPPVPTQQFAITSVQQHMQQQQQIGPLSVQNAMQQHVPDISVQIPNALQQQQQMPPVSVPNALQQQQQMPPVSVPNALQQQHQMLPVSVPNPLQQQQQLAHAISVTNALQQQQIPPVSVSISNPLPQWQQQMPPHSVAHVMQHIVQPQLDNNSNPSSRMSTPVPHPSPQKEKEVDERLAKLELGIEMLLTYFKPTVKLTNFQGNTPTKATPQTPSKTSPQRPVKKYTEMPPKRISSPVKPISLIQIPEKYVSCFNNSLETEEDESFKEVKATVDNIINSDHLDADDDSDNQNLNYDNFKMKLRQRKLSNCSTEKVLQRKRGRPRKSKYVNIDYV